MSKADVYLTLCAFGVPLSDWEGSHAEEVSDQGPTYKPTCSLLRKFGTPLSHWERSDAVRVRASLLGANRSGFEILGRNLFECVTYGTLVARSHETSDFLAVI